MKDSEKIDAVLKTVAVEPLVGDDPIGNFMLPGRFAHLQRVASIFSASKMIPEAFRGDVASCAIVLELAVRLGVAPFMLFHHLFVVHGKPGLDAQIIISLVNQRGPFAGPIQWEFSGEGKSKKCTAFAIDKASGSRCEVSIDMKLVDAEGWASKSGSKWLTMQDQMFRYRTACWLARAYCPEVTMGLYSREELDDISQQPAKANADISTPTSGSRTEQLLARLVQTPAVPTEEEDERAAIVAQDVVVNEKS